MEKRVLASTIVSSVLVLAVLAPTPSQAVTPDRRVVISPYWTFSRAFAEWFDWRSYAGWGTVGAVNVAALALYGASEGDLTSAAFSALCGATASGLLGAWKPPSDPTAASHIKAMVKAAGTTAVSTTCMWVSKNTFSKMDTEIRRAAATMGTDPDRARTAVQASNTLQNATAAADISFTRMARWNKELSDNRREYDSKGCRTPNDWNYAACLSLIGTAARLGLLISQEADQILRYAAVVKNQTNIINNAIRS